MAPGGGPVVADLDGGRIFRLRPDGLPDRRFGNDGRLTVGSSTLSAGHRERLMFYPRSIAVDHAGRVVIFGEQTDSAQSVEEPMLGPVYSSSAVVLRLDASGRRDPSFGDGRGYVRDDFGLVSPLTSEFPMVGALTGVVDSHNRPVLVAGVTSTSAACTLRTGLVETPKAVVRLTSAGAPDPTFGVGGVSVIEGATSFPELQIAGQGQLAVEAGPVGVGRPRCRRRGVIYRLGKDGERSGRFGTDGTAVLERMHLAALEPSGAVIVSRRKSRQLILSRLTPSGVRDPRFGRGGTARIDLPAGPGVRVASVLVDRRGRILIAGFSPGRPKKEEPASFFVARVSHRGTISPGFGSHGWLRTRFPRPLELTSAQARLDYQGRLVVAGTVATPDDPDGGFLVARYLEAR